MITSKRGVCALRQKQNGRYRAARRALLGVLYWLLLGQTAVYAADTLVGAQFDSVADSTNLATDRTAANIEQNTQAQPWAAYGQFTNTYQWHPAFTAPYSGTNSLNPSNNGDQTNDVTMYLGYRLSPDSEIWINPEYDQGFGLSNTLGVAGFPSGEAYKVGKVNPYYRTPRLFVRQAFDLGGAQQSVEASANQMAGSRTANNVIVTIGKFAVTDVFDTNAYAHDPRNDFLNWSVIEAGAFDYAADAWGYTYGASAEWTQDWWTLRGGMFDLSATPNSEKLTENMSQYELVTEFEARHQWLGQPGKLKLLVFDNHANMGSYSDALHLAAQTGSTPNTALVRHVTDRPGIELNLEQALAPDLGMFARASANDGSVEAYDFTDINQSVSAGLSLQGNRWGRSDDTLGAAAVVNGLSGAARAYFAAGGLGILVGDGQLPHYATEQIAELYYAWQIQAHAHLTADYQYIVNPAYNADRGPVNVYALRLHLDY